MLLKEPDSGLLEKLPEDKRKDILHHKFAFVCYKDPQSAINAVNEVPYSKIEDSNYNNKLNGICKIIKPYDIIPEK